MRGLAGAAPPTESPISRPVPRLRRSSVRLGLPTEDDLHPDSALVGLVRMMEDPSSAQPSVVLLACVGFVLAEFSSHDPAGVRTRAASTTFVNLGCMAVAGGDMDAVAAATKALLLAVDEPQREAVLQELRPLLTFTNFPLEQLPAWARKPRSWSGIRQLFAKDVSALFKRK